MDKKNASLKKIIVKGYKSIKELDINLKALTVLIGANGAGKSNFISLFELINKIIEKSLEFYVAQSGGADTILYFGQQTTDELFLNLRFENNGYSITLIPTQTGNLMFSSEDCYFYGLNYKKPYEKFLGGGHKETRLYGPINTKMTSYIRDIMKSWKIYHFNDTGEKSKMKQKQNIDDNIRLKADASNIASFLYLLKKKYHNSYRNIIDTIQLVAPFFDDFILRPDPINDNMIQLEWKEKNSDAYFNAHSFSDGTLRFICLATLLLQPQSFLPSVILLDEPELGLHPYAISVLSALLKSVSTKTQVIISTQSVTLVNQFDIEDIVVVDRDNEQSTFKHLEKKEMENWLEDYGLGDLWEKNIFGGRP